MDTQAGRFEQRLGKNWLKVGLGTGRGEGGSQGVNAVTRKGRSGQAEESIGNTEMRNLY